MNSSTDAQKIQILRSLRGAPLTILVAMMLFHRSLGVDDLEMVTGIGDDTVRRSLASLESMGYVSRMTRKRGYVLTALARQMMLPGLLDQLEDGNDDADIIKAEPQPPVEQPILDHPAISDVTTPRFSGYESLEEEVNLTSLNQEELTSSDSLDSGDNPKNSGYPSSETILAAAEDLFHARIRGAYPGEERLLLAWIAHAHHKTRVKSPAGLVYWGMTRGKGTGERPDKCYLDHPDKYLPVEFLEAIGLDPPGDTANDAESDFRRYTKGKFAEFINS